MQRRSVTPIQIILITCLSLIVTNNKNPRLAKFKKKIILREFRREDYVISGGGGGEESYIS